MGKSIRNLSTVTRVDLDLAKRVFQVHAVDARGEIVVARKLMRSQLIRLFRRAARRCVVAMGGVRLGVHHWGRALIELGARGSIAAARACEALCPGATRTTRGRRGGDLRGDESSRPAVRAGAFDR